MGALLAFVLPATSAGTASMIPERLAGWWLASAAATAAVLLLSPRPASDRSHAAGAALAGSLADELDSVLLGSADGGLRQASLARNQALRAAFAATPYRPTGLAVPDQAFANLVESLEWCCSLVGDVVRVAPRLAGGPDEDRLLVDESSRLLRAVAALLSGRDATPSGWSGTISPTRSAWEAATSPSRWTGSWAARPRAPPTGSLRCPRASASTTASAGLVSWYDRLALSLAGDHAGDRVTLEAALPAVSSLFDPASDAAIPARAMWIGEHLRGLRQHLAGTIGPALELSAARRRPWWR
jgi:hypothetical protein